MARNRKRAKERRARRPQPVASRSREGAARGGVPERLQHDEPQAQEELEPVAPEPVEDGAREPAANGPIESLEDEEPAPVADEPAVDEEPDYEAPSPIEHAAPDTEIAEARLELGSAGQLEDDRPLVDPELETEDDGRVFDDEVGDGTPSAGEVALPGRAAAGRRELPGNRLIGFLQGSWRELQRVQWPDRRQVMQATGVVIGFVIVAGVFLGVSDWVAGKVVSFVVNGHF